MQEKAKSNSVLDAIPDWIWWIVGGGSGFIAGHVFSMESSGIRGAVQSRRMTMLAAAAFLVLVFGLTRRMFPAFANVALWCGTLCLGLVRW
jgi:hypothetical protein